MKIYISVDMEGIPGTFNWEHEKVDRISVRKYMQEHIMTALEAILSRIFLVMGVIPGTL